MKKLLFPLILAFAACHSSSDSENDDPGKPERIDSDAVFNEISTENLARYFGNNFHVIGNNPCIYFDSTENSYFVCGKKVFEKFPADQSDAAVASYIHLLYDCGYAPDGKVKEDTMTHVNMNGKDYVYVQMSDLLPEMTAAEKALFHGNQLSTLNTTSCSYGYHYLSAYRHCPNAYAASEKITLETGNPPREISADSASYALKLFTEEVKKRMKK